MRQITLLRSLVLVGLLGVVAFASSGCGGGGAAGTKDLVLERMLLVDQDLNNIAGTGATNAFRDTRLLFQFNVPLDPATVSDRTIRIGIPTGDGLLLEATGRFEVVPGQPSWVLFDPTYTRNNQTDVQDNPLGFNANSLYEVRIPSVLDQPKHLRSTADKGIVSSFTASFQTSDEYLQTFSQPELVSTSPENGDEGISATADILLTFNEAMKPDSFILGETIDVFDRTNQRDVLGTIRFSADAKTVTFRPVFGYGVGPNEIRVAVTRGAENLPGNPIARDVFFAFTTENDPTQPDFGDVTENFETSDQENRQYGNQYWDPLLDPEKFDGNGNCTWGEEYPLADWDATVKSGLLAATFTTGTITLSQGSNNYSVMPFGWGQNFVSQGQILYLSGEIGSSRTITGMDWYYRCLQSSTVTAVTLNLGHSQSGSLTTAFAGNFSDTPVAVVSNQGTYLIPQTPTEGWLALPTFQQNFRYNGTDNMILEVHNTNGPNGYLQNTTNPPWVGYWRHNPNASTNRVAYNTPPSINGGAPVATNWFQDTRINYLIDLSEAQSFFYDTGINSPQFLAPLFVPAIDAQPAGTSSTWTYQGAPTDPDDFSAPDLDNLTEWTTDLSKVSGFRFLRFRVVMKGNETTGQTPSYEELILPYIFF